jgi:hypothetical protein
LRNRAALASPCEIVSTPKNDYLWRVHVPRAKFQERLSASVEDMTYTNFKNRIHDTRGDEFYSALSEVWSVMHAVEDRVVCDACLVGSFSKVSSEFIAVTRT